MKSKFSYLYGILAIFLLVSGIRSESDVLSLKPDELEEEAEKHDYLAVLVGVKTCKYCHDLLPEWKESGKNNKELKIGNIQFAYTDISENPEIKQKYSITYYPTTLLFKKGVYRRYQHIDMNSILLWLRRNTQKLIKPIKTQEELTEYLKLNPVTTVSYIFDDNSHVKEPDPDEEEHPSEESQKFNNARRVLKLISEMVPSCAYALITDKELAKKNGVNKSPTAVSHYYDKKYTIDPIHFSIDELEQKISTYSLPDLIQYSKKYYQSIDRSNVPIKCFIVGDWNDKNDTTKQLKSMLTSLGEELKGEVQLLTLQKNTTDTNNFLAYFGCNNETVLPQVFAFEHTQKGAKKLSMSDARVGELIKYRYSETNQPITVAGLRKWYDDIRRRIPNPFHRSEESPEVDNDVIHKIVGKDFKKIVGKQNSDVIVLFLSGKFKKLDEAYQKLMKETAEKITKDNPKGLYFGEIDMAKNEVANLTLPMVPLIVAYFRGLKEKPLVYAGPPSVESFEQFILQNHEVGYKHTILSIDDEESLIENRRLFEIYSEDLASDDMDTEIDAYQRWRNDDNTEDDETRRRYRDRTNDGTSRWSDADRRRWRRNRYYYQPPTGYPGTQYTYPGTQYTYPGTQYTYPGTQYTTPGIQYTYPGTQYTYPGTQYTTPGTQYTYPGTQYTYPNTPLYTYPSTDYSIPTSGTTGAFDPRTIDWSSIDWSQIINRLPADSNLRNVDWNNVDWNNIDWNSIDWSQIMGAISGRSSGTNSGNWNWNNVDWSNILGNLPSSGSSTGGNWNWNNVDWGNIIGNFPTTSGGGSDTRTSTNYGRWRRSS